MPTESLVQLDLTGPAVCGLTLAGEVECWGSDYTGLVSGGPSGTGFTGLSCGLSSCCALDLWQQTVCWGANTALGVTPTTTFATVKVGQYHACGRTALGVLECWGFNYHQECDVPQ